MAPGASSSNPDGNAASGLLLDFRAYSPAHGNASTAVSKTSTGLPIEVTFFTARPPVLSHFSVRCPGLQLQESATSPMTPKAIAADADLVLLRVPIDPLVRWSDYFVYKAHPQHPKLDLLPKPSHQRLGDNEIAILSCADGKQYAVAALKIKPFSKTTFTLHLYRSKPDGERGNWTIQQVSVEDPLRDRVCPVPDTAERLMYHLTTKVIALGGSKGTVGWVDLWRGILLCDVLEPSPKLRDMPLPLPSKGNWGRFLNCCEEYYRDITVSQDKNTIKYVEMEITPPRVVTTVPSGTPDPDSYLEWVRRMECPPQRPYSLIPGRWKIKTWSMPIPVTSWHDWSPVCTAKSAYTRIENQGDKEFLHKLSSSHQIEASEATLSLGCLCMAYPTMSVDDDVVYLLTKATGLAKDKTGAVVALDVKRNVVLGVAKLDSKKYTIFMRCYLASGISKHLNTTGIKQSFLQAEEHMHKPPSRRMHGKKQETMCSPVTVISTYPEQNIAGS